MMDCLHMESCHIKDWIRVCFARELVNDVRMYMDDWVLWDPAVSFDDPGHEVSNTPLMNERKRALESIVANLESLL